MWVEVREEDIRDGKPGDPRRCALALAFRRSGVKEPEVSGGLISRLPSEAFDFVRRFDARLVVWPIAFDLL